MSTRIPAELADLAVPLDSLIPYPDNPRQGDVGAIVESLQAHGQYRPVVVNLGTHPGWTGDPNTVLAGNHTVAAAVSIGWTEIAATFVDVDDDTALRIVLVDNRSNDRADYDVAELVDQLTGLAATPLRLEGTGFELDDVDALVRRLAGYKAPSFDLDNEWDGMPGYESDDLEGAFRVAIRFVTMEHADEFFRLIDRPKSRTLWWPNDDGHAGSSVKKSWVHEDDE